MSKLLEKTKEVESKNVINDTNKHEVTYKVWQAENLAEVIEKFGGEAEVVSRMNGVYLRGAEAAGIRLITNSDATTAEAFAEVTKKGIDAIENYKPESTTGVSVRAKAESVDNLNKLAAAVDFSKVPGDVMLKYLNTQDASLLEPYKS